MQRSHFENFPNRNTVGVNVSSPKPSNRRRHGRTGRSSNRRSRGVSGNWKHSIREEISPKQKWRRCVMETATTFCNRKDEGQYSLRLS